MASPLPQLTLEQQKELQERLKKMSPEELMEFQKQQCIFCQIISGKIPAKKLYEDDQSLIILDINPASRGHLLLLPKKHYAILPQLNDGLTSHLFSLVKKYSKVLLKGLKADGTTIFIANGLVAGQKAQHFMIHLIPRKEGDSIMALSEKGFDASEVQKVSIAIENKLNGLLGMKKEVVDDHSAEKSPSSVEDKKAVISTGERSSSAPGQKSAGISEDSMSDSKDSSDDSDDSSEEGYSSGRSEQKKPPPASQKKASPSKKEKKSKTSKKEMFKNEDKKMNPPQQKKAKENNEHEEEGDGSDTTVSLDDIADLFR